MRRKRLLQGILLILLCFFFAQPYVAAEQASADTELPEGWIAIHYLGEEDEVVMIPAGCAIADLWEPETVYGYKFLYWTTSDAHPFDEQYRVTKETVFYKSTFLYPVTEHTAEEIEEAKEFAENWEGGGTEQWTEEERDYYIVKFCDCDEDGTIWEVEVTRNKALGEERFAVITEALAVYKGHRFVGWYTEKNGGGKEFTGKTKVKSDMSVYAHWEKVKVNKVSIKQLYGKDKAIMVKYKKQSGVKGYQVQVSTSKAFKKKNTITKTYNNNSVFKRTIKKLKKGQTYYVRIRAYKKDSAGSRVYGKWSKVKQIQTK